MGSNFGEISVRRFFVIVLFYSFFNLIGNSKGKVLVEVFIFRRVS